MSDKSILILPNELEKYRSEIEQTMEPLIEITTSIQPTNLFQSKFGGHPYLPKSEEYPTDSDGKLMKLLAQINFEETPNLKDFPKQGILQFYLCSSDDLYGVDFDDRTNQSNFRIVYHPHVIKEISLLVTDFSYLNNDNDNDFDYFPVTEELALSFSSAFNPISRVDYRFDEVLGIVLDLDEPVDYPNYIENVDDLYFHHFSGGSHKIGGYPYFTQWDPRELRSQPDNHGHDILLLQIDSDELGIEWGDAGVCNFFIKKEDLQNLDFTNVLYNWDCH